MVCYLLVLQSLLCWREVYVIYYYKLFSLGYFKRWDFLMKCNIQVEFGVLEVIFGVLEFLFVIYIGLYMSGSFKGLCRLFGYFIQLVLCKYGG